MSEVAVGKKMSESRLTSQPGEVIQPTFPFGRFFNVNPFAVVREFAGEMDRMFRTDASTTELQAWAPTTDVQWCDGDMVLSAELPGLKKEDVKIEITGNVLTIQGERKQEHKEHHDGYHRWERNYGRFYRAIQLPESAKTDQVKADLKDGILKVLVPVPESPKRSRQVPVSG